MKNGLIASIIKMIPNGNRLELPKNDHFENYIDVKKALITAGGKYSRCGFVFTTDAAIMQTRLVEGEVINDKKKYQFFATPLELAKQLVDLADIQQGHSCLEPSAGQGAISDLIILECSDCVVIEMMPENIKVLRRKGYDVFEGDFLEKSYLDIGKYDRIVANPPFTKNQDIDHIIHMYSLLKTGGKIISLSSKSWLCGKQKKQVSFREWLDHVEAETTIINEGAFKESGTSIGSVLIEITK